MRQLLKHLPLTLSKQACSYNLALYPLRRTLQSRSCGRCPWLFLVQWYGPQAERPGKMPVFISPNCCHFLQT